MSDCNVTCLGKPYDKEPGLRRGRGGTMQEWMEGADMSQFFTMDYSHVRRRRPIHNKSVPVGPWNMDISDFISRVQNKLFEYTTK